MTTILEEEYDNDSSSDDKDSTVRRASADQNDSTLHNDAAPAAPHRPPRGVSEPPRSPAAGEQAPRGVGDLPPKKPPAPPRRQPQQYQPQLPAHTPPPSQHAGQFKHKEIFSYISTATTLLTQVHYTPSPSPCYNINLSKYSSKYLSKY